VRGLKGRALVLWMRRLDPLGRQHGEHFLRGAADGICAGAGSVWIGRGWNKLINYLRPKFPRVVDADVLVCSASDPLETFVSPALVGHYAFTNAIVPYHV